MKTAVIPGNLSTCIIRQRPIHHGEAGGDPGRRKARLSPLIKLPKSSTRNKIKSNHRFSANERRNSGSGKRGIHHSRVTATSFSHQQMNRGTMSSWGGGGGVEGRPGSDLLDSVAAQFHVNAPFPAGSTTCAPQHLDAPQASTSKPGVAEASWLRRSRTPAPYE